MGSSSAWGYFTISGTQLHPRDSGWAFKLKKHFKDLGIIDTLYNIAANSSSCYDGMPSSYTPPPGRNQPYYPFNITRAVSLSPRPDVIIVNYPTNQYDYLSKEEILFCLQTIKDSANAAGIRCFITTTQPRDNFSVSERQKLKEIRDMIMQRFGAYAIDFWTEVTVPVNMMNPQYNLGDNVHLNPAAHTILKNRAVNANIFFSTVPVSMSALQAQKKAHSVVLNWSTFSEINSDHFEIQRSSDGKNFVHVATIAAAGNSSLTRNYMLEDTHPNHGKNIYRVVEVDINQQKKFSNRLNISFEDQNFFAGEVYSNPVIDQLAINLESDKKETVAISIFSTGGKKISTEKFQVNSQLTYKKDWSRMPAGRYTMRIQRSNEMLIRSFMKL